MKKPEKKQFSYLKDKKQINVNPNKLILFSIAIFLSLIILFIVTLFNHRTTKLKKQKTTLSINDNQDILLNNEKRLLRLQKPVKGENIFKKKRDPLNKVMLARQNAPTEMYINKQINMISMNKSKSEKILNDNTVYASFANQQSAQPSMINATRLKHPNDTIALGEFIHATLITAINSDLPGMISAIVTRPVYSYTGEKILVPKGSRLIGQYTSIAGNGIATMRIFIIWNQLITPTGISVQINSTGTDSLGRSGIKADTTNTHFFKMFSTAALLSIMSATAATYQVGSYDQPNSANQYQQQIAQAFQQSAQNSLNQNLKIKPTLTVYQGKAINIFVAHNLDFYQAMQNQ